MATATKGKRKYSRGASKKVEEKMRERKRGTLRSGSGKKVTSRKQAIAIGLSEARREGEKAPKKKRAGGKKRSTSRSSSKRSSSTKKTRRKKSA